MAAITASEQQEIHLVAVHEFPTWFWRHAPQQRAQQILSRQVLNSTYSWEIRRFAAMALGEIGQRGATGEIVPVLARTLERSLRDWSVRQEAAIALGRIGLADIETALPPLGVALADADDRVRTSAQRALIALGQGNPARVTSLLVALLADNDSLRAVAAAETLGAMNAVTALRPLAEAARPDQTEDREGLRAAALTALGEIGARDVAFIQPVLLETFNSPNASPGLRRSALLAAAALARSGAATLEQEITAILRDPTTFPEEREMAAEALGNVGPVASEITINALISALAEGASPYLKTAAARALGEIGPKAGAAILPLFDALEADTDDGRSIVLRIAAAEALGRIITSDRRDVILPLAAALSEANSEVRGGAEGALAEIARHAPAAVGDILLELLQAPTMARQQKAAARTIARMQTPPSPQLLAAIAMLARNEAEGTVQLEAVIALGKTGAEAPDVAVPALLAALNAPSPQTRQAAAQALAEFGRPPPAAAIPALLSITGGPGSGSFSAGAADFDRETDTRVQRFAVMALGRVDPAPDAVIDVLIFAMRSGATREVRRQAARSLGSVGTGALETVVPALISVLGDRNAAWLVREAAGQSLGTLLRGDTTVSGKTLLAVLDQAHDSFSGRMRTRVWARLLAGDRPDHRALVSLLGRPDSPIAADSLPTPEQLRGSLGVLLSAFDEISQFPRLRRDAGEAVMAVVGHPNWPPNENQLLTEASRLFTAESSAAVNAVLRNRINETVYRQMLRIVLLVLAGHALLWLVLFAAYPHSRAIQWLFFWNKWVRLFGGLGYVTLALVWLPPFRRRLLRPFRDALVMDALLEHFDDATYFRGSQVRKGATDDAERLVEALPRIRGQIVLEGESGLGKTMFLRHLATHSQKALVFVSATRCFEGVFPAIHAKIRATAPDGAFLRRLVRAGALDVIVDGLNEVAPHVHAQVVAFAEENSSVNLLISTQPMEWQPPSRAMSFTLEPLSQDQIIEFLLHRATRLPAGAAVTGDSYREACQRYVVEALADNRQEQRAALRSMSNPMDLTVIADMIAQGEVPDLLALSQQQYELMAQDFARRNNSRAFPLDAFSERTFELRLNDEVHFDKGEFQNELTRMYGHRMVVSRPDAATGDTVFEFRHDKITDFFLCHAFTRNQPQRQTEFLHDARFRGVYILLATHLPYEDAKLLRESLITHAADTRDHSLSDEFVQVFSARTMATVLFSDLVSSTDLQKRIGDSAFAELVTRHNDLCQHAVQRHGGQLVKFTGDGFLATFLAPSKAVGCAEAIRTELDDLGLRARFGVHSGEIERREGDIIGVNVVIAARIMERASGGQLLVSDLTRQLMRGSAYKFKEFETCALKGLTGEHSLFEVRAGYGVAEELPGSTKSSGRNDP